MGAEPALRRAAALVIGNELLRGKVQDANVLVLSGVLFRLGVVLERVVVIPDDMQTIVSEVKALADGHDFVFTSGGVGPTHDDLTVEAVARAFGVGLVKSLVMEGLLRAHYRGRCTEGHLRMALVPDGAELAVQDGVAWPTIIMRNVWLLPGVPEVFKLKMSLVRERLKGGRPFVSQAVYTNMDEGDLKPLLDRIVAECPEVCVGSYPKWFESDLHDEAHVRWPRARARGGGGARVRAPAARGRAPAHRVVGRRGGPGPMNLSPSC